MNRHSSSWGNLLLGILLGAVAFNIASLTRGDAPRAWSAGNPIGDRFWPSEFGEDDQRGAANRLTQELVAQSARLINEGRIFQLGRPYEHGMRMPDKRRIIVIFQTVAMILEPRP